MDETRVIEGIVAFLGLLCLLTNAMNLATLWNYDCEKIFRRSMCYMVACLAVADLLTGVNTILWGLREQTGFYPKQTMLAIYWTTVQVSFLSILAMAVDRFIAVTCPTNSETIVSHRKTLVGCAVMWILSSAVGLLILFYPNIGKFVFCVLFEVNIAAVVVMYALMYRKARAISKIAHSGQVRDKDHIRKATVECCLFTVVLSLVGLLVLTVLPYILAVHIQLTYFITSPERKANPTLLKFIAYYFPVELVNFLVNPIIYAWRLPKYRKALLDTFSCVKRSR